MSKFNYINLYREIKQKIAEFERKLKTDSSNINNTASFY